jgi:alpha-tubulin suppressor-like RCC1 family protein
VGSNETSQLGIDGTSRNKAVVVLENVARVAAGYDHTLAVTEDGKLWAAGSNQRGQFGDIPGKPGHYYTWIEIDICSLD